MKNRIRLSLRNLGRKNLPKRWHEHGERSCHATASFRRDRVRWARRQENRHLANCIAQDRLGDYEPLGVLKRDADWLYF